MQLPRSLVVAAAFGLIWAAMTYYKKPGDWITPLVGFLAFVIVGPLLGWLIKLLMRLLRRSS